MPSFTSLDLRGYQGKPLANTLVSPDRPATHLGIIFPGYAYSADAPVCYYTRLALLALGADVLSVETNYNRQPGFASAGPDEQAAWIASDADAALAAALDRRTYARITLAGKSIGTRAVAHLAANDSRVARAACLWLTPIFGNEDLREQIIQGGQRGLFVAGTADSLYDAAALDELLAAVPGERLIIEGGDHGLEIPGDVRASARVLERLVDAEVRFLAER